MANKEYNVIISDRAASELRNHIAFLARVAPDAAKRLHKELISEIESLAFMPESFPWLYHELLPKNKYRKKLAAKRYLLIYQIKGNTVYLDYILDCRLDYRNLL